ncbi:MAG: hypothetical protein VKJ46_13805, partial [Leptolyngbyaceae bacterium]|nr:hypothetical protein [Leptolyngbyaceae bacterium]
KSPSIGGFRGLMQSVETFQTASQCLRGLHPFWNSVGLTHDVQETPSQSVALNYPCQCRFTRWDDL